MSRPHPTALLLLAAALVAPALTARAAELAPRVVDHRFAPPTWHAALGFPGDWHKPLANERGALLTDFGPGPYAKPLTEVEFTLSHAEPTLVTQRWADGAAPVLVTALRTPQATLAVRTFSVAPAEPAASRASFAHYERLDGITGARGWAKPTEAAAPEFSSVAWGTNRPLRYRVRVEPGAAKRVVLGYCESWKPRLNERVAEMRVEGAPSQTADLALTAARHAPQVFTFAARDENRDGWLEVTVLAPVGHDPNTTLSYLALYAADAKFTREDLLAGRGAELRIDCGAESDALPARYDIVAAESDGSDLVLRVRTGRALAWDSASGTLRDGARPFVLSQPHATAARFDQGVWTLELPAGTRRAHAVVLHGAIDAPALQIAADLRVDDALAATQTRWQHRAANAPALRLGDSALDAMVRQSARIVDQSWETVEGRGQFNSSFSLYRGLWAGDVVYAVELASLLGDRSRAREQLRTLWHFQNAAGLIDEMPPLRLNRTTGAVLWATHREAELSGDLALAREQWPAIRRAVAALATLRAETLKTPDAAWTGLLPPGFNDGGIMEVTAEYSSVYWSITGLRSAAKLAQRLGETQDAAAFTELAQAFQSSFERAAQRDLQRDAGGNAFLPVRVGRYSPDDPPPLAQWAVLEAGLFGDWLPATGPLLTGTLGMLQRAEAQGLPASTGWMRDGIWAGYGALYAHLPLLRGEHARAIDLLYAVANHASPVGGWVEEQSVRGAPLRLAGDQPHCWASALFVRLALSLLVHERGDEIHLAAGVAPEWLRAGATNASPRVPTRQGSAAVEFAVDASGETLHVRATAPAGGRTVLHLSAAVAAGFALPAGLSEQIAVPAGQTVAHTLHRRAAR